MKTLISFLLLGICLSSFANCEKAALWEAKKYVSMKLMTHTVSLYAEMIESHEKYGKCSFIIDVYHQSNFDPVKLNVKMVEYTDGDCCEKVEIDNTFPEYLINNQDKFNKFIIK